MTRPDPHASYREHVSRDRKKFHEWNEATWESPPDDEPEPTTRPDDWPYPTIDPTCAQDLK